MEIGHFKGRIYIERGSFSEVFLVSCTLNNVLYALKSIEKANMKDKNFNRLVSRELKIVQKLSHP